MPTLTVKLFENGRSVKAGNVFTKHRPSQGPSGSWALGEPSGGTETDRPGGLRGLRECVPEKARLGRGVSISPQQAGAS